MAGAALVLSCLVRLRTQQARDAKAPDAEARAARREGMAHPDPGVGEAVARASAADGPLHGWVAGRTAAGPRGLVPGPVTGIPGVWYFVRVSRLAYPHSSPGNMPTLPPKLVKVQESRPATPFLLRDDSGSAEVSPDGMAPDFRDTLTDHRRLGLHEPADGMSTLHYSIVYQDTAEEPATVEWGNARRLPFAREEWLLPADHPVHINGLLDVTGTPRLAGGPQAPLVLSTRAAADRLLHRATTERARGTQKRLRPLALLITLGILVMLIGASLLRA